MGRIADIEDRDFHSIVASGLEFFDDWVVRLGDVAGIKQEIEADFHEWDAKLGNGGRIGKVCVGRFAFMGTTGGRQRLLREPEEIAAPTQPWQIRH